MKPAGPNLGINRRTLISTLALLPTLSPLTSISAAAQTQSEPRRLRYVCRRCRQERAWPRTQER
jgi:hypothetical protein